MFILVTMVVFILQNCVISNGKIVYNHPKPESYQKNLFRILEKYLEPEKVNFCVDCNELIHLVPRKVPLVTIKRKGQTVYWPAHHKVDAYILDLTKDTEETLEFIEKIPGWNPRAKFFIVYRKRSTSYLLKALFSKYIVNVAIFSTQDNETLTIRTYDPFKNRELYPKSLKAITKVFDSQLDLFPNKYPRKWNNITVKVLPVCSPPYVMIFPGVGVVGLDVLNLKLAGSRIGVKFTYSSNDLIGCWGEKGKDGKYNFAFGALQAQEFGISAGSFQPSYPQYVDFDMTYPVMEDYLVLVVPASPIKQKWKCFIDIFKKPVWILLVISILLMVIIFYVKSINKTKYELSASFLICLACLLKNCISRMPRTHSQRLLLMIWILFCFMIVSYFESHLQGVFNVAHREKQIDSIEEIERLGMKVGIQNRHLQLFNNESTEIDRFVSRNHYITNVPIEVLNNSIVGNNKSAVIVLERFIRYSIARYYVDYEDGSSTVHTVSKKLMFFPLTFYFTKGFPLFDGMKKLLHDLKAIGCIEKLYRYYWHMVKLFSHRKGIEWKVDPINLIELKYVLLVLFGGYAVSCLVLILEISWHKITMSKN